MRNSLFTSDITNECRLTFFKLEIIAECTSSKPITNSLRIDLLHNMKATRRNKFRCKIHTEKFNNTNLRNRMIIMIDATYFQLGRVDKCSHVQWFCGGRLCARMFVSNLNAKIQQRNYSKLLLTTTSTSTTAMFTSWYSWHRHEPQGIPDWTRRNIYVSACLSRLQLWDCAKLRSCRAKSSCRAKKWATDARTQWDSDT